MRRRLYHTAKSLCMKFNDPKTVSVIGAPIAKGQPRHGVNRGPNILRESGLFQIIQANGWAVKDCGDIKTKINDRDAIKDHPKAVNSVEVGKVNEELCQVVYNEAQNQNFCLQLGGDHSIAIGSIAGILKARPKTGIIWVDAHADLNTHETSPSGNIHGMSVAYLMKLDQSYGVSGFEWLKNVPTLNADQIVYIGLRDVDKGERSFIKDMNIKSFSMHHIDKYGIGNVMEQSFEHLSKYNDSIHMSIDIDSVDPFLAPSTGTQVRGGLSFREAHYICESAAESGLLGSIDMVEVNPYLYGDTDMGWVHKLIHRFGLVSEKDMFDLERRLISHSSETVDMAIGMIESCLGKSILDDDRC